MKPSIAVALITCVTLLASARPFAAPQRGSAAAAPLSEETRQQLMASTHVWREDLGRKLLSLQHPEGFWVNEVKDELQGNPVLVTGFTMQAIEAILEAQSRATRATTP